jgi:hypothetical protein
MEGRRREEGEGKAIGLARAGVREGWRRSDFAALDLEVGCDNGRKAAGLARAGAKKDGGARI